LDVKEGHLAEEIILTIIIILNIMDFFKILPPWLDYIKKILSWVGLAYIVYKSSPTKLILGEQHHSLDVMLIISYFFMIVKNLVSFAALARASMINNVGNLMSMVTFVPVKATEVLTKAVSIHLTEGAFNSLNLFGIVANPAELAAPFVSQLTMNSQKVFFGFSFLKQVKYMALQPIGPNGVILQFYNTLVNNSALINKASFLIGIFGLLLVALYTAFTGTVSKKSVLAVLGAKIGIAKKPLTITKRFFLLTIIYSAFFIIIFNLFMEWFAIAVDAPLIMIGLITYIFLFVKYASRRRKKFAEKELRVDDFIERINGFGFNFYYKFVDLFKKKKTILLGLSGILILHLLTDIVNYLLPYLIGIKDILYLGRFSYGHNSLFHYLEPFKGNIVLLLKELVVYLGNFLGVFFLLFLPAYIWYKMLLSKEHPCEKNHSGEPKLGPLTTFLAYFSLLIFLLIPAFKFTGLNINSGIIGVNILTQEATPIFLTINFCLLIALVLALLIAFINYKDFWHLTILPLIVASIIILGVYAYHFFMSSFEYYALTAFSQLSSLTISGIILGFFLILFLFIDLLFYILAFFSTLYEMRPDNCDDNKKID